jgi:hypothetical protein
MVSKSDLMSDLMRNSTIWLWLVTNVAMEAMAHLEIDGLITY